MALFIDRGIATWNKWPVQVNNHTAEEILSFVKQYDLQKVILYAQYEWAYWPEWPHNIETFYEIAHELYRQGKKLTVVAGANEFYVKTPMFNVDLHFYPEHTIARQYYNMLGEEKLQEYGLTKDKVLISNIENLDYKYHFISMNHRAHHHRMEMMDLLAKHKLLDHNAVSWHNWERSFYEYKYWIPEIRVLSDNFAASKEQAVMPLEYYHSFAQLVVESTTETFIVTDKTAAPLIVGKPFLVASSPFFHRHLKTMGFELYDEIFDYSFDDVFDRTVRYDMIAENLANLCKVPHHQLKDLAKKIRDKVEYNKQVFEKIVLDFTRFPEPIKFAHEIYENEGIEIDHLTILHWRKLKTMAK